MKLSRLFLRNCDLDSKEIPFHHSVEVTLTFLLIMVIEYTLNLM